MREGVRRGRRAQAVRPRVVVDRLRVSVAHRRGHLRRRVEARATRVGRARREQQVQKEAEEEETERHERQLALGRAARRVAAIPKQGGVVCKRPPSKLRCAEYRWL